MWSLFATIIIPLCLQVSNGLNPCIQSVDPSIYGVDLGQIDLSKQDNVSFVTVGDWGVIACNSSFCNETIAHNVIKSLKQKFNTLSPSFLLSLGDHFYPNGLDSVNDTRWNISYENLFTVAQNKYMYSVMGNHGYYRNGINYYLNRSNDTWDNGCTNEIYYTTHANNIHNRWCMPSYFYTFSYKLKYETTIRFIAIDTDIWTVCINQPYLCYGKTIPSIKQQWDWLTETLNKSIYNNEFIVAFSHHPFISLGGNGVTKTHGICANTSHFPNKYMIDMMNLFEKYNVSLFVSGHEHSNQIFVGQKKSENISLNGHKIVQLITSSMGRMNGNICGDQQDIDMQYNNNKNVSIKWNEIYAKYHPGFGYVRIDNKTVDIMVFGYNGKLLSNYSYVYDMKRVIGSNNNNKHNVLWIIIIVSVCSVFITVMLILMMFTIRNRRQNSEKTNQYNKL